MKEFYHGVGFRVDAGEIGAFVKIAELASKRQVIEFVGATMFYRDDMLDVIRVNVIIFVQPAVFASVAGPVRDRCTRRTIHALIR